MNLVFLIISCFLLFFLIKNLITFIIVLCFMSLCVYIFTYYNNTIYVDNIEITTTIETDN
jgi:dolichyl-phosphate-mannose--protein O-mannosyl transferase